MRVVLFDTETTGLIENRLRTLDKQNEVTEFYGCEVDMDTGEIFNEFGSLIKPANFPIKEETYKKSKSILPNELLVDAPRFAEVAGSIKGLLEGSPLIIAHNASFDQEIIDMEFERIGQTIKWPQLLCTVEQTVHLTGKRLSLSGLHEYLFKCEFADAHRAKSDVHAMLRCVVELRRLDLL